MNTEQNYVGGGNYATPTPSTGQNRPQMPTSPDSWQIDLLQRLQDNSNAREWLFAILDQVRDHAETYDPTEAIDFFVELALDHPHANFNSQKARQHLTLIMKVVTFESAIRSVYGCFNSNTNYAHLADANNKEEVSRD